MASIDLRRNTLVNGLLYLLAAIGAIVAAEKGWHLLEYLTKPALMIILSSWFFFNSRRYGDRFTLMVQAGLFFSLLGDVALMLQHRDEFNFLIGLAAFLMAQLCYTIGFAQNAFDADHGEGLWLGGGIALVIAVFGFFFAFDLMPYVESGIQLPVIAYIVGISLMGMAAALRFKRTFPRSFWLVLVGALLFIASDSLLARNRFVRPFEGAGVAIMVTYVLAQFCIAAGCLLHVLDPEEIRRRQLLRT